jgi:hypothetical protein
MVYDGSIIVPPETRARSGTNISSNSSNLDALYYLVWLDINANNDELTKSELKSVIKCGLLIFDNVDICEQYVSNNPDARFIFIVSYEFGSEIAPRIVSHKQVITILVYSKNNTVNTLRPWTHQYLTVRITFEFY